jgi:hypothetical protein
MTRLARARLRLRLALQHRPFWIEIQGGAALAAWGIYTLLLPMPLGQAMAWSVVADLRWSTETGGTVATGIGLTWISSALMGGHASRAAAGFLAAVLWVFATRVSSGEPHPGLMLYAAQAAGALLAVGWHIFDQIRARRE